jgi:hypothetical protein
MCFGRIAATNFFPFHVLITNCLHFSFFVTCCDTGEGWRMHFVPLFDCENAAFEDLAALATFGPKDDAVCINCAQQTRGPLCHHCIQGWPVTWVLVRSAFRLEMCICVLPICFLAYFRNKQGTLLNFCSIEHQCKTG